MIECNCIDCGEPASINALTSGSMGNLVVPSRSWCKCVDRETNPDKKIGGLVIYHSKKTFVPSYM